MESQEFMEKLEHPARDLEKENADENRLKRLAAECRRLESRVDEIQTMEAVAALAGGIAHDFNNILASLIGFTELALDDAQEGTPLEDNLQEAYRASMRAKELVQQILAIARQSDEPLKPIRVDIIAKELLKFLRAALPATTHITKNIRAQNRVMGNLLGIYQILINLCTNAAQAMAEHGGILDVRLNDAVLADENNMALPPGNYVEIIITASGKSMGGAPSDPRADPRLSTVLKRIHDYRGKIVTRSQEGYGTMTQVYLPAITRNAFQIAAGTSALPTGSENILLIDDEQAICKMGQRALERLGYHVTVCTDGAAALELITQNPGRFDLVISDMTMPDITGERLSERIRAIEADLPIILCTGHSRRIAPGVADQLGIKALLPKPVTTKDLAVAVRCALDDD